jgi:hypothetical protein
MSAHLGEKRGVSVNRARLPRVAATVTRAPVGVNPFRDPLPMAGISALDTLVMSVVSRCRT